MDAVLSRIEAFEATVEKVRATERRCFPGVAFPSITVERPLRAERGPGISAVLCCHACEESIGIGLNDVNVAETFLRAHRSHREDESHLDAF